MLNLSIQSVSITKAFDSFWDDLLIDLRTPKKITNWTVKQGSVGEDFTA